MHGQTGRNAFRLADCSVKECSDISLILAEILKSQHDVFLN